MDNSNAPWYGPGRPLIVADPNKLSYFAQANAVRAGVFNTWGALSGFGDVGDDQQAPGDATAGYAPLTTATDPTDWNTYSGGGTGVAPPPPPLVVGAYAGSTPPTPPLVMGDAQRIAQPGGGLSTPPLVSATTGQVMTPSGGSTLSSFFSSLNNLISPAPTYNSAAYAASLAPSPLPWILGIGVLGVGAIVLLSHKKKAR